RVDYNKKDKRTKATAARTAIRANGLKGEVMLRKRKEPKAKKSIADALLCDICRAAPLRSSLCLRSCENVGHSRVLISGSCSSSRICCVRLRGRRRSEHVVGCFILGEA